MNSNRKKKKNQDCAFICVSTYELSAQMSPDFKELHLSLSHPSDKTACLGQNQDMQWRILSSWVLVLLNNTSEAAV